MTPDQTLISRYVPHQYGGVAKMNDFKKQYELWDEFLNVWPLARLAMMTLDDYTEAGSKGRAIKQIEAEHNLGGDGE